jgi:trypsin
MRGIAVVLCLGAVACTADGIDSIAQPIINGSVDTAHDAVVAVLNTTTSAQCSGTIIAVRGTTGFVLTAAHCLPMDVVAQGDDYLLGATYLPVADAIADPAYDENQLQNGHDYALIQFTGALPTTPVIPAQTPAEDALVTGQELLVVGFGVTATSGGDNSQRRSVSVPIESLDPNLIAVTETTGGGCNGDSGGPGLTSGPERVAGVTSFGDINCNTFGGLGRVSSVYDSFIAPAIGEPTLVDAAMPDAATAPGPDGGTGDRDAAGNPGDGDGDGDGGGCCEVGGGAGDGAGAALLALAVAVCLWRRRPLYRP